MKIHSFRALVLGLLVSGLAQANNPACIDECAKAFASKNYSVALTECTAAAEYGHVPAQRFLGSMYAAGWGTQKDYNKSAYWLRKAADQGDASAQKYLSKLEGKPYQAPIRKAEIVQAENALSQAAPIVAQPQAAVVTEVKTAPQVKGPVVATEAKINSLQDVIAECDKAYYADDHSTAYRVCGVAAEQGDVRAQFKVGLMYFSGKGVSKDYKGALKWYRKAAEQGYGPAQMGIGYMYEKGLGGVNKDDLEALTWYRKAADQGNESAQSAIDAIKRRSENRNSGSSGYSTGGYQFPRNWGGTPCGHNGRFDASCF